MIKSILEKNILSNNLTSFRSQMKITPLNLIIKLIPFICACGNLLMLEYVDSKVNINTIENKEECIRMGLVTDNYTIVNYLYPKKCMDDSIILRYYICSGGYNSDIYNLLDKDIHWKYVTESDIKTGYKNGNLNTIKYLKNKLPVPIDNYNNLPLDKHRLLLNDNNILNYYIDNNYNIDIVLDELYQRKQKNMIFFNSIIILKKFFIRIRNQIK